ncbi:MAG: glycosyl transferase family 1, partial [Novosphingobium sp.]|nr:glycosyl transferase family 1 [Novosphingobium sp.]
ALASGVAVSLTTFQHRALRNYVEHTLGTRPIDAIYVFSGQMGQYVPDHFCGRVIADFVDVDSAKFEAYAARNGWPRGWIDAREARLLRWHEARLAARADVSLLISKEEAALFASRLPEAIRKKAAIRVLANGIDAGSFDPALIGAEPRMLAFPAPRLILTGQMDYAPNIAAAERVIARILPLARQHFPSASFHVVGRNPPSSLRARHGCDGCFVWGRVPDMRP